MTISSEEVRAYAGTFVEAVREPFLVLDGDFRVVAASRAFYHKFRLTREESEGCLFFELGESQWDIPNLRHLLENTLLEGESIEDFKLVHLFPNIGKRTMLLNVRRTVQSIKSVLLLVAIEDITDSSAVQKEIEEKSFMFDALLDSLPEVILFTDVNHAVKKVSRYAQELFGLSPERLMQADEPKRIDLLNLHLPNGESLAPDELPLSKAVNNGESFTDFEITVQHPDDVPRYFSIAAGPVRDFRGNIVGAVGGWRDITERKRAEESLAIERGRLRATLDSIPDEIWIADKQGDIIYRSAGSIQDSLGKCDWPDIASALQELEILNSDGTPRAPEDAALPRALRGEILQNEPEMIRNVKTGELRCREVSSSPIRDHNGNIIGAVALARDVTERKRAEEAVRRSEARFRQIFYNNMVPMATWKKSGDILDANDVFLKMIGYTRADLEAGQIRWEEMTPAEYHKRDLEAVDEVQKNGFCTPYEKMFRHKDGHLVPILIGSGTFDKMRHIGVLFALDLTERKKLEQQLQELNQDLERRVQIGTQELKQTQSLFLHSEKLAALGKLSASIAHEVNNPLQAIMTILQGVKASSDESDRKMLEMAIGEGNRIKKLIRNLQDFYRPSPERKNFTDLHNILDGLLLLLHSDLKKKRISIERHYADQLPHVLVIPDQIKQVFINLLSNAAEACFEGGGVISISTHQKEDGKVSVAIKDTGVGIRPENLEHIFRPFFTTKSAVKGTGLGLSVTYGIVRNHGGEILVESLPGEGATFTVLLPIKETSYHDSPPSI